MAGASRDGARRAPRGARGRGLLAERVHETEVALYDRSGSCIRILEARKATARLLCGEPLDEPIVGHGPFVMNRPEEIQQAILDYQSGGMGHLS